MMVSKKRQRILTNTGRLDMVVRLLKGLTKEMNHVVQLLRDDGVSVSIGQTPNPAEETNDSPDGS